MKTLSQLSSNKRFADLYLSCPISTIDLNEIDVILFYSRLIYFNFQNLRLLRKVFGEIMPRLSLLLMRLWDKVYLDDTNDRSSTSKINKTHVDSVQSIVWLINLLKRAYPSEGEWIEDLNGTSIELEDGVLSVRMAPVLLGVLKQLESVESLYPDIYSDTLQWFDLIPSNTVSI